MPAQETRGKGVRDGLRNAVTRNVFLLGIVSLCNDIASEMLYPLIPIFLTATLGAPVFVVGMIEGIAEAFASILKGLSGWWSDRIKSRKRFVFLGYACSTAAKAILGLAYAWPIVLLARLTDKLGKGVRTAPRDALIAESTSKETYATAFGFHRAMDTTGAVIGPLLAILLLRVLREDYRLIFLLACIPAGIALLFILPVREAPRGIESIPDHQAHPRQALSSLSMRLKVFILINLLFSLGNSSDAFLILRAKDLGLPLVAVILTYVLFNLVYAVLSTPAGIFADRVGKIGTIAAGFFLFALVYLGFALGGIPLWAIFSAYGAYMALTDGVGKAFVAELAPAGLRGTALGFFASTTGIAALVASTVGGILWSAVGPQATFLLGTAMAALAGCLMTGFLLWKPAGEKLY